MAESSIEWTDATWNPVAGCTVISAGCSNCYAMRMAARLEAMGVEKYQGLTRRSGGRAVWTGAVRLDHEALGLPSKWTKPRMVFVNSMADLFHEAVPEDFIAQVWQTMAQAHQHTFQVLTKRADRLEAVSRRLPRLPNVWLGVSIESPDVFSRLASLKRTSAAVRFVSLEPLLASVAGIDLAGIDWAIVGGESGPMARPMKPEWVDEVRSACRRHDTAFFFKQWGGRNKAAAGRQLDGRTWDEYPISAAAAQ